MNYLRLALITLIATFAFSSSVSAHGGQPHLLGTVKAIDDKSITVETADHQLHTIKLASDTKLEKAGVAATAKDVAIGARVVVHAKKSGDELIAVLIKLGDKPVEPGAPPHNHRVSP